MPIKGPKLVSSGSYLVASYPEFRGFLQFRLHRHKEDLFPFLHFARGVALRCLFESFCYLYPFSFVQSVSRPESCPQSQSVVVPECIALADASPWRHDSLYCIGATVAKIDERCVERLCSMIVSLLSLELGKTMIKSQVSECYLDAFHKISVKWVCCYCQMLL